jgi:ribA/ribD-fused uncharacterized protein
VSHKPRAPRPASAAPAPPIAAFHGDHFFLSNFSESPVVFDGQAYPTVEHAFQAAKTFEPEQRQLIRDAPTPATAKRLGRSRQVDLRADWEQVKFDIMYGLLKQKFARPICARRCWTRARPS